VELFLLSEFNSLANNYLAELRDVNIQADSMRFRKNMERIGEILAYEISKDLEYSEVEIKTPLGESKTSLISKYPYLITIMRAGIPFYQGFLNFFERSESGFIGAFRSEYDENQHFNIDMGYMAIGDIQGKELILVDPMLATGKSIVKAVNQILKMGLPKMIHIVALIASKQGFEYVKNNVSVSSKIWIATMDKDLNDKSYIVPGLGDAGDLCYGKKT
jgi:uracil phosphoribosyltransferase